MRAIIMCAGMASRMHPISLLIHKALLPVEGLALVEHTIQYLHSHGVQDITLVLGYKSEDFLYLEKKYGVSFRISTKWETHNNYSSMQIALDKLDDCIVLAGDIRIVGDFIPQIDRDRNQYFSQKIADNHQEWGFLLSEDARIIGIDKKALAGDRMLDCSYWTGEYTAALAEELGKCTKDDYWDDANLRLAKRMPIYVNKFENTLIEEYDSVEDLLHYKIFTHAEIANLCSEDGKAKALDENNYEIIVLGKSEKITIINDTVIFENNK